MQENDELKKKRILFVDDDLNVLHGLKRMLRPMRHEWDMEFASDGQEALLTMSKSHFDVIVSDMRMPRMNGSELLQNVLRLYPECVRIAISGNSDEDMILNTVKCAHQFLMKPCDAELVKSTITRACNLRDILEDNDLIKVVSGMNDLPSLPNSYNLIIEEMQTPEPSLKKVGDIIANDVSMSAKILQLVNSAFFGLPQKIVNPQQAAIYLGVETLKALVLSTHVFSSFKETSESLGFSISNLFEHCMKVMTLAKKIIGKASAAQRIKEEVIVAGLLHDLGKLLMLNIPNKYKQIQELNDDVGCGIVAAEYETLNTSHAEMGAYLLGLWGIPIGIVEAVAFHHYPSRLLDHAFDVSGKALEGNNGNIAPIDNGSLKSPSNIMNANEYNVLTAVHVANALINQDGCIADTSEFKYLDMSYLRALDVAEKMPEWVECYDEIKHVEE